MKKLLLALAGAAFLAAQSPKGSDDPILRAMREELDRSRALKLAAVDTPYYIEYALDDLESFAVVAALGALINSGENRVRVPRVQVRVGDYEFDNTNYVFSDFFGGGLGGRAPLDDDPNALRHTFWLATDRVYKGAVEAIARKRAALKSVTVQDKLNDFAKAEPATLILPERKRVFRPAEWTALAKALSAVFVQHAKITSSQVEVEAAYSNSYYINSEGSELRYPDDLFTVRVRAMAQAPDGMPVRDAVALPVRTLDAMAAEPELRRRTVELARSLEALLAAPAGEDYSGPALVEGMASPQLFAHLLGANLGMTRRPVTEPGRNPPLPSSELEGRMGSRILPEWMDAVDDPTQQDYRGRQLLGYYPADMEAVVPKPVRVIENGELKNFLLTRLPVRGFEGSNGRARLPGPFGTKAAVFSNLFVRARQTTTAEELKKKLLELCAQRAKPYGIIVRKLDFPATGGGEEFRRMGGPGQRGGITRPAPLPVLVYRIYPDGREELVRGLRLRGLNVRSLRDIVAASDVESVFDFVGNGTALPVLGQSGYVTGHTVVAPSVLFEDFELERREEDWPKLPVAPPPALTSMR